MYIAKTIYTDTELSAIRTNGETPDVPLPTIRSTRNAAENRPRSAGLVAVVLPAIAALRVHCRPSDHRRRQTEHITGFGSATTHTPAQPHPPVNTRAREVEPDTVRVRRHHGLGVPGQGRILNGGAKQHRLRGEPRRRTLVGNHAIRCPTSDRCRDEPAGPLTYRPQRRSVAFDLRHHTWLNLVARADGVRRWRGRRRAEPAAPPMTSRTWSSPVAVDRGRDVLRQELDRLRQHTHRARSSGHCYTEFDNASMLRPGTDVHLDRRRTDLGTGPWPPPDSVHGLGGQPVIQPNGRVVVPFEGVTRPSGTPGRSPPTTAESPGDRLGSDRHDQRNTA